MLVYYLISLVLTIVCVGWVLLLAAMVYSVVMSIIAAVQANKGVCYRYPITIRVIK